MAGDWYIISTIISCLSLLYTIVISIVYRKALGNFYSIVLLAYCVIPILALSVQLLVEGLEIAYASISLFCMIVYVTAQSRNYSSLSAKKALRVISYTDDLTGLNNRREYDAYLSTVSIKFEYIVLYFVM